MKVELDTDETWELMSRVVARMLDETSLSDKDRAKVRRWRGDGRRRSDASGRDADLDARLHRRGGARSVDLDKIVIGADIADGDVVVGLRSNGVHSNGLTLARKALLGPGALRVDDPVPGAARSVGEELLAPTHIHVAEALEVLDKVPSVKAPIHITGDGCLNLTRLAAQVGSVRAAPPPARPPATGAPSLGRGGAAREERTLHPGATRRDVGPRHTDETGGGKSPPPVLLPPFSDY